MKRTSDIKTGRCGNNFLEKLLLSAIFSLFILSFAITPCWCEEYILRTSWEQWEPYSYKDADGKLTGLDMELLTAIAGNMKNPNNKNIRYRPSFKEMPWARALKSLEYGKIDVAMSGSLTEERKKYVYYTKPYRKETFVLYILKEDAAKYGKIKTWKNISELNLTLGVTRGYYYGEAYDNLMKTDKNFVKLCKETGHDNINYKLIMHGRINGFIGESAVTAMELRKKNLTDKIVAITELHSGEIFGMFSKKSTSPEIIESFNRSMSELKDDIIKITKKYED
ncbi:MAG: amino acid ABC transporter substrate-binding protein [Desulfobacterales bacterium]|nr:amino acid ABC transporter substrate-binding protein [Desulfobacterales bacterium]